MQKGNADMKHQSGRVISREQGMRYDAAPAVPCVDVMVWLG